MTVDRDMADLTNTTPTRPPDDIEDDVAVNPYHYNRRIPLGNGCYRVLAAPASE